MNSKGVSKGKNPARQALIAAAMVFLLIFVPSCTLTEVNLWRETRGLVPLEADHPDTPALVAAATKIVAAGTAKAEERPLSTREIARRAAESEAGWGHGVQWRCLQSIVDLETGRTWKTTAQNPRSTAYGLFGFLNSTWGATGVRKSADAWWQTVAAVRYTQQREGYRTPCRALRFHQQNGYW